MLLKDIWQLEGLGIEPPTFWLVNDYWATTRWNAHKQHIIHFSFGLFFFAHTGNACNSSDKCNSTKVQRYISDTSDLEHVWHLNCQKCFKSPQGKYKWQLQRIKSSITAANIHRYVVRLRFNRFDLYICNSNVCNRTLQSALDQPIQNIVFFVYIHEIINNLQL